VLRKRPVLCGAPSGGTSAQANPPARPLDRSHSKTPGGTSLVVGNYLLTTCARLATRRALRRGKNLIFPTAKNLGLRFYSASVDDILSPPPSQHNLPPTSLLPTSLSSRRRLPVPTAAEASSVSSQHRVVCCHAWFDLGLVCKAKSRNRPFARHRFASSLSQPALPVPPSQQTKHNFPLRLPVHQHQFPQPSKPRSLGSCLSLQESHPIFLLSSPPRLHHPNLNPKPFSGGTFLPPCTFANLARHALASTLPRLCTDSVLPFVSKNSLLFFDQTRPPHRSFNLLDSTSS
jgi:hypothetical protein